MWKEVNFWLGNVYKEMCEIFGDYGWAEGVRPEKYLADHFMVRGINRFVPHAFSPKAFPDTDCPPHFYVHGNNPQYRHFGMLMRYMNRICELLSDGRQISHVAILYHGDADWAGGKCMFSQVPARELADCQIQYDLSFELTGAEMASDKIILEITDAAEAVEVFVNGVSAGIQIVPAFRYDIAGLVKEGSNTLAIEVAITLERAVPTVTKVPGAVILPPANHCGITGEVRLYIL